MTNIFEQLWLLLIVSGCVLLAVVIFRWILPQSHKWWFWLVPAIITASAFAIDFFVRTDAEKIDDVIAKAVRMVEREDAHGMGPLISEDYHDSIHASKQALLRRYQSWLNGPVIEKNICRIVSMKVEPPNAEVVFTVRIVFDPQGPVHEYSKIMLFKLKAEFRKQGGEWRFSRIEVLEPGEWRGLQTSFSEAFD